jgi:hypothetical protein
MALSLAGVAQEQEDKPEIKPKDWTVSKKKEGGPRALAVLKITSTGKATLVPITIRIDGKFYDASAYKANPVPMSLDSGTVYEGERGGASAGLFTVASALHSQAANNPDPWIGTGIWLPTGTEAPKSGIKAETVPVGIESSDAPPKLSRNSSTPTVDSKPEATPPAKSTPDTSSGSKPADSTKPADASKPADSSAPKQEPPKPTTADAPKPADKDKAAKSDSSSSDSVGRPGDDVNRPRLRRGKPIEPLPADEAVPGYGKPNASGAAKSETTGVADAAAWKAVQLIPAISDAGGPDPRSFVYEGSKDEDDDRYKQIVTLAKTQLAAYMTNLAKGRIEAAPAPKTPAARRAAAKTPQPVLENIQVKTFDLWKNNQPVLVLSADAQIPPSSTGATSADTFTSYSITLVARVDIYRDLVKIYSSVTDKYHLDVTPRLDLIDAVDADGDGRGELLFHKTSDTGSGYVIYRASADTLWKMFDSLNP